MKENQALQRDLQMFLGQVYLAELCPPQIHIHEEPMKAILGEIGLLADVIGCSDDVILDERGGEAM